MHAPATEERSRAAALAAAIDDPAVVVDGAGRVLVWNAAAGARFGLAQDAVAERSLDELRPAVQADPVPAVRITLGAAAGGGTLVVWCPTPETLPADALKLQKLAALAWLAGPIRHELFGPLGAVSGVITLIAEDPRLPPDLRELASVLDGTFDRTLAIMESLLEALRTRDDGPLPVALAPVVRGVMNLGFDAVKGIVRQVDVPEDLPEVVADAARLRQAILAVIVNAVVAMGGREAQGHLRVTARLVDAGGTPAVRLTVEDSAPTVPEPGRGALFGPAPLTVGSAHGAVGAPTDGAGAPAWQGTNLAVAARLMALDHGRIWHEPRPDGNAVVMELLTMWPSANLEAGSPTGPGPADRRPEAASAGADTPEPGPPPIVVLVCDDNQTIRALVGRMLERAGMRTITAASGEEAMGFLADAAISVVLADHHMPGMTGPELYRRALTIRPDLAGRFLLMSGDAGDQELNAFASAAGLQIVPKPFDFEALPARVRAVAGG